jgi:hypothetical protein
MSAIDSTLQNNTIQPAFFLGGDDPPARRGTRSLRTAVPPLIVIAAALASATAIAHPAAAQTVPQPDGGQAWRPPAAHLLAVSQARSTQAYPMYRVHAGDTMSGIALHRCANPADWTGIYRVSRDLRLTAMNANDIRPGQMLAISCTYVPASLRYAPQVILARSYSVTTTYRQPAYRGDAEPDSDGDDGGYRSVSYAAPATQYHATTTTYSGSSGCQAHIIADESGGNARAVNPQSGAGGLYQFLPSTWAALGHSGLPENASVAEQNQAYYQQVAQSGYSAWNASGGCG